MISSIISLCPTRVGRNLFRQFFDDRISFVGINPDLHNLPFFGLRFSDISTASNSLRGFKVPGSELIRSIEIEIEIGIGIEIEKVLSSTSTSTSTSTDDLGKLRGLNLSKELVVDPKPATGIQHLGSSTQNPAISNPHLC